MVPTQLSVLSKTQVGQLSPYRAQRVHAFIEELIQYEFQFRKFEYDINSTQRSQPNLIDYMIDDSIMILVESRDGSQVLGMAILRPVVVGDVPCGALMYMQVHQAYRQQGIGKMIVERVQKEAKQQGIKTMLLTVLPNNPGAPEFYDALGYESTLTFMAKNL